MQSPHPRRSRRECEVGAYLPPSEVLWLDDREVTVPADEGCARKHTTIPNCATPQSTTRRNIPNCAKLQRHDTQKRPELCNSAETRHAETSRTVQFCRDNPQPLTSHNTHFRCQRAGKSTVWDPRHPLDDLFQNRAAQIDDFFDSCTIEDILVGGSTDPRRNNELHCVREFLRNCVHFHRLLETTTTGNL